jgi:hypothetical protein
VSGHQWGGKPGHDIILPATLRDDNGVDELSGEVMWRGCDPRQVEHYLDRVVANIRLVNATAAGHSPLAWWAT